MWSLALTASREEHKQRSLGTRTAGGRSLQGGVRHGAQAASGDPPMTGGMAVEFLG